MASWTTAAAVALLLASGVTAWGKPAPEPDKKGGDDLCTIPDDAAEDTWTYNLACAATTPPDGSTWKRPPAWWGQIPIGESCNISTLSAWKQSPIDIDSAALAASKDTSECLPQLGVVFNAGKCDFADLTPEVSDGVLRVGYYRSACDDKNGLPFMDVAALNRTYYLQEIRFHVQSEHTVNGGYAPAEVQLIHKWHKGEMVDMVALSVLVAGGGEAPSGTNSTTLEQYIALVVDEVGVEATADVETFDFEDMAANPYAVLPSNLQNWAYRGSLTSPPCYGSNVTWAVSSRGVAVSDASLADLTAAIKEGLSGVVDMNGYNVRPTQNINITNTFGRVVSTCNPLYKVDA